MKYLAILALAAMTLSLGACAKKQETGYTTTTTTTSTGTTGYSKN